MHWQALRAGALLIAIAGTVLVGGPATADSSSLAVDKQAIVPWTGTITAQWRETFDDGGEQSGQVVYTVTGGNTGPSISPAWSHHAGTASGSGSWTKAGCGTSGWTLTNAPVQNLRLGITDSTVYNLGLFVEFPDPCPPGQMNWSVGITVPAGSGGTPLSLNDDDPDPNIRRGTTVFTTPSDTYTLTYDLRRAAGQGTSPVPPAPVQTPLTAPTKVKVTVKKRKARVTWKPVADAQSYQVRVSPAKGKKGSWKQVSKPAYTSGKLKDGTYVVNARAVSSGGTSPATSQRFKVK
jgi:methionine-rich copper-binding protein CopC